MVQKDHSQETLGEPPQLGDSWWKAALSEVEAGFTSAEVQEDTQPSSEPHILSVVNLIQPENNWDYIDGLYQRDEIIQLKVVGCNQGGLLVQGEKINGFVPSSHLLEGQKKKEYLGQAVSLKVIEYDKDRCRVVLSERAAQAEPGTRLKLLDTMEEGTCIPGTVTTLTDFGAFVDLGGMEGLIHISELSWGRVDHPSDVVEVGDALEVYVLNIDRDENKVALSLKKMCNNPWETITERYHQGQIVEAVVKNIVSYGAFVRIEEGVDGLIHVSELGENGDQVSPWDVLEENQKIEVEIIHLDPKEQRLGLSLEVGK
ncbi:MAG: S1 RNA-binding domain-containing protein [Anaerolineales bacterium]|nr:S1 RNA-binding domain-containing protein [Anaerolineales bacterium]